jgi:hypothetical protein
MRSQLSVKAAACAAAVVGHFLVSPLFAVQYPNLLPGYTQEIYTAPLQGGPGMAWTSNNHLLTRNGSTILEYSPTQNTTINSTNLHSVIASYSITGLDPGGVGMTNGTDGYIYAIGPSGVQRIDPNNWAAPAQTLVGTVGGIYGITTLPDGRLAYSNGIPGSSVWIADPTLAVNSSVPIYTGTALIDGMVAGPLGNIAITGQDNSSMTILTSTGAVVNSFPVPHYPDGLAFSATPTQYTLYSNNNDGTITRYDLGLNFTGAPTITDIAFVSGAYGDLASVGPDCAFYVSQFNQTISGYHGSVPGVGTHWDDNVTTTTDASIIRIGGTSLSGLPGDEECLFYSPIMNHEVPEPASFALVWLGLAIVALGIRPGR